MLQKFTTKWNRLVYRAKNNFFTTENVVTIVSLFFCALLFVGTISIISRNSVLHQKLTIIEGREEELISLNDGEVDKKRYYESSEFKELVARDKLNKKAEGETMLYMPENSEEAKHKYDVETKEKDDFGDHFSAWFELLFR